MTKLVKRKLPTISSLVKNVNHEANELMVLLNQNPPREWVQDHPTAKIKVNGISTPLKYIARERLEHMISAIYGGYRLEIKSVTLIANSPTVVVRVYVTNPVTGLEEWQDGIGAVGIQTDSGSGATNFDKMKSHGVQIAAPAAETYAFKDAVEKFGKIFGRDLNVQDIDYIGLLKEKIELSDLKELFELKQESMTADQITDAERIIQRQEESSYSNLFNTLQAI